MKIKKLIIKNYRNLKDISLDFDNLNMFIGKNDVGKSNILGALDLFFNWQENSIDWKEVSTGGSGNVYEYTTSIRDYRLFFDQKPGTIKLVAYIELDNEEIEKIFPDTIIDLRENNEPLSREEIGNLVTVSKQIVGTENKHATWKINSIEMENLILYRKEGVKVLMRKEGGIYSFTGGGEDIAIKFLNLMKNKFLLIPAIRNIEKEGRLGNPASLDGKFIPNEFLKQEKNISFGKEKTFQQINKDLSKMFPKYQNVASMEDTENNIEIYFNKFPSSSIGDGVKQQFINNFNINSHENIIFGIEEPEIHLHPEAQRKAFDFLKEKSKEKQIIMTTHSTLFVDCSNGNKVYLVKEGEENVAELKLIENKDEFNLIKYELGAKNTDLFFYNAIVLIEGNAEERAFPIISDALGYDLNKHWIRLINIKGKDKLKKINEFLKYVKDSDVKSFIILDKDNSAESDIQDLIRAGLLKGENYHIWDGGDFEDCFTEEQIIIAMKKIIEGFNIKIEDLKKERKNKKTSKILNDFLYEKSLGPLNKPALGEELARIIKEEIENNVEREKTEPEKIIEKIVKVVENEN